MLIEDLKVEHGEIAIHGSRCPVCGTAFDRGATWICPRCESSHHADCADYFGGCAIFGCRDGHPPTRIETAQWPEAATRLGAVVGVRRAQSWCLRVFGSSIVLGLAGPILVPVKWSFVAVLILLASGLAFFASGLTFIVLMHVTAFHLARLQRSLGVAQSTTLELSAERVRRAVGIASSPQPWATSLEAVGVVVVFAGLVGAFITLGDGLVAMALGVLIAGSGWQTKAYERDNQVFLSRFDATFAPIGKSKSNAGLVDKIE